MQLFAIMAQLISLCSCIFTVSVVYFLFKSVESELQLDASELVDDRTYDEWFQSGMTAYTNEEWADTIWYFENALKEFKYYRSSLAYCRIKCQNLTRVAVEDDGLNEQRYFQAIFRKALCIRKCKYDKLGSRPERINQEVTDKFLSQTPYSYLQFAYYKNLEYEKAVAAAFTYVQANPDDDIMYNNLNYYRNLHGISDEQLVDLEEKIHNRNFLDAYAAYEIGNWTGVIVNMESALVNYWMAEEECRAMCEGKYENREFMDLYEAIANHYASTLFCKDQCETWLATIHGKVVEDYLPNHFHFLQFAYFQAGDLDAAVSAAAAFLLIKPGDETMLSNMAYYENQQGVNKYTIRPRTDAYSYKARLDLETEMLEFAKNEFWGEEDEEFLEEVMSTLIKDVNYLEAEPIRSSEVRLKRDKGDMEEFPEETSAEDEPYLEELRLPQNLKGDVDENSPDGARFGRPAVANVTPHVAEGQQEGGTDDEWGEDESLPDIEYAPDDFRNAEELVDGQDFAGQYEDMTEEEMIMDKIKLQHFLNEDIDEDDWIEVESGVEASDVGDEEEGDEEEDGDKTEDDDNDDLDGIKTDRDIYLKKPTKDVDQDSDKIDIKQSKESSRTHSNAKQAHSEHTKHDSNVRSQKSSFSPPSGPSEPSGPAKTGPSTNMRTEPREGDLNGFVRQPTEPITIYQDEGELNGTNRVAADGVATDEECATLIKLIQMEARGGDGYDSSPYVHTKYEVFEGVTVKQATAAAKSGRVSMFYPLIYMHVAERSRQFVEEYFDLKEKGLYFSYTHLVCRTAEPDSTSKRKDLSHPIHADNCQLDHHGECHKKLPAFIWRDWSAITYLNDDFEGGEFIFAHANQTVQAELQPRCGRIVAFSAGAENLHGVKSVIKGARCALALWFTHDSRYRELDFFASAQAISEMYDEEYGKDDHDEL